MQMLAPKLRHSRVHARIKQRLQLRCHGLPVLAGASIRPHRPAAIQIQVESPQQLDCTRVAVGQTRERHQQAEGRLVVQIRSVRAQVVRRAR